MTAMLSVSAAASSCRRLLVTFTLWLLCFMNAVVLIRSQNVLFMLCDDCGNELSLLGHTDNETPNLDALAAHSVVFHNAFTSVSSCSPSRSAILTGLPVHQNGMYGLHQEMENFDSFSIEDVYPLSLSRLLMDKQYSTTNKAGEAGDAGDGYLTGIIGKYHVGPVNIYPFNYSKTERDGFDLNQVGRNITFMKELLVDFLDNYALAGVGAGDGGGHAPARPFFIEMAFIDTHRGCGGMDSMEGPFCNNWGNGSAGMGSIPDWHPQQYNISALDPQKLPFWIPTAQGNNGTVVGIPQVLRDYAAYLTSFGRMDQGVGLFIDEFRKRNLLNSTMIIFTSDNGEPFPSAKTNLYEQGQREPFMISIPPMFTQTGTEVNTGPIFTDELISHLDILPTVLDYCHVQYPNGNQSYQLFGKTVELSGMSILPVVQQLWRLNGNKYENKYGNKYKHKSKSILNRTYIYGSHVMHEVTMYYPMRIIRNAHYRLVHNLLNPAPFHIAADVYGGGTWQYLLNGGADVDGNWYYANLSEYYFRAEYQLYDIVNDEMQLTNLAYDEKYAEVFEQMQFDLQLWTNATNDPWTCVNYKCWNP